MLWTEVERALHKFFQVTLKLISRMLFYSVAFYRFHLAHIFGGHCRFYPSCSCYAEQAFRDLPLVDAVVCVTTRLLRCHPFSQHRGFDPVPLYKTSVRKGELS